MTAVQQKTAEREKPGGSSGPTGVPRWDMSRIFPSVESAEFQAAFEQFAQDVAALRTKFDYLNVRKAETSAVSNATVAVFDDVTRRYNQLGNDLRTLNAYLGSFVTTNSRDDLAQARLSELQAQSVELRKLGTRYEAWIGSLDVEGLIGRSEVAKEHAFPLRKLARGARHQMSEAEEDLAASLNLSSGTAWAKLHGNISSQLMVQVTFPEGAGERAGKTEELPMSAVRGLAHDPNPEVRRAAYEAELKGWERVSVPLAAAMNGIKGEVHTLNTRRGWPDALEPVLFINNIDRPTLDAMHEACMESFPDFRRYLRAKAKLLGKDSLPWYDMFAPVGGDEAPQWTFDEAAQFVVEQFGSYSGKMADLARRALREKWVDAEPREGKRDGAFCLQIRNDESGVFMNFEPSFNSVGTLAHELGHAYHNTNLAQRTPLQRQTPMALAETASIMCQTIVTNAALAQTSGNAKLSILEGELQNACQIVIDIHSRFLFEQRVFELRARRELSVKELNELMLQAQRETYGDGLDQGALHEYMWAMKPHYYSTGLSYYNWPYTFGLLFGLGLYAQYKDDADRFRQGYDDLLSSTGLHPAADLGQRFGIDIRSADFWRASLDVCREMINEFEELAAK